MKAATAALVLRGLHAWDRDRDRGVRGIGRQVFGNALLLDHERYTALWDIQWPWLVKGG
jgi:hypothetical protein